MYTVGVPLRVEFLEASDILNPNQRSLVNTLRSVFLLVLIV